MLFTTQRTIIHRHMQLFKLHGSRKKLWFIGFSSIYCIYLCSWCSRKNYPSFLQNCLWFNIFFFKARCRKHIHLGRSVASTQQDFWSLINEISACLHGFFNLKRHSYCYMMTWNLTLFRSLWFGFDLHLWSLLKVNFRWFSLNPFFITNLMRPKFRAPRDENSTGSSAL